MSNIVRLEKNCGNSYIIRAPKGHIICGPVHHVDDSTAVRWAKGYISSFDGWRLEVTF